VKLGQICKVQGGYAFKTLSYLSSGIPLVRISNLSGGQVNFKENTVFLPVEFVDEYDRFLLRDGDILMALSGATTGKMAVYRLQEMALLNQRVGRFHILDQNTCDSGYMSLLASISGQTILKKAYSAAQPNISPSEIEAMLTPLPPLKEQREIVRRVQELFAWADSLEARYQKARAHFDKLAQATLAKAFRGELVPQDPNDEPASELLARIRAAQSDGAAKSSTRKTRGRTKSAALVLPELSP